MKIGEDTKSKINHKCFRQKYVFNLKFEFIVIIYASKRDYDKRKKKKESKRQV